uniref:TIL domain-containing protein n=1 Tax=Panagrellus redivivus TaxID=6233 RepID=A0A7E4UVB7_PANRE
MTLRSCVARVSFLVVIVTFLFQNGQAARLPRQTTDFAELIGATNGPNKDNDSTKSSTPVTTTTDPIIETAVAPGEITTTPVLLVSTLSTVTSSDNDATTAAAKHKAGLEIQCGLNEELKTCGTTCPRSCMNQDPRCDETHCISDICQCIEGYVVHHNGTCVHPDECPSQHLPIVCPINSHLAACGSLCQPTCDHQTPTVCSLQCIIDACVCDEGYVLDESKVCIRVDDCPPKHKECASKEVLVACGTECEPTCDEPFPAFCSDKCVADVCQCADGFVRSAEGNCVHLTECFAQK